jgi:amino acid adenylation domain-containing protein
MVPAAYVRLEALPLTPNGKLDRKALPAPDGDAFAARGYEAPSGQVEQAVSAIWAELLGAERVGRGDHFFELGGHSLLAVRVVSRVRQALGVEAAPADLFERPVLADFARGLGTAARAEAAAIERVDRTGNVPLSFAQQRLWFLEQMGGMGAAYHIPMSLRLHGALDRDALVRALDRIVARHEALRTTFPTVDGEPVQRIAPAGESGLRLVEHDLRASRDAEDALSRLMADEASAPFNLAHGPLVRGRLVRMAADDHVLLLTMHHIVSDGWSAGVLYRELGALYAAFTRGDADPLPPLPVQYADYAAWHRRRVEGPVLEAQAEYWTRTLAGAPELLELPADHPRPPKRDFAGASVQIELDEALTASLRTLSQRHGTTLFMTLLAGWAAVLGRLSGQADVVIGTPSANRGQPEVEELIGFFVNTLPVRVELSGSPTVAELLARVKGRALEAQQNQDIPFEQVVELLRPARTLAYSPLFQVLFTWDNAPGERLELPGLQPGTVPESARETAKFDLTLALVESGDRIVGELSYATALFERATAERFSGYLRRVLEEMAADGGRRMERLALMPDGERSTVLEEWNRTEAAYPAESSLHALFEAQVERTPDAVALVFEGQALTYAGLNARANRLAHFLAERGVGPDVLVGLSVERSLEMMVGLLAVLKAGGAYVALDPSYPEDRLRYMLADSGPVVLLTQASLAGRFGGAEVPVVALDADAHAWAGRPETNPRNAELTPDHLAYVIYTSGSTGMPKGVMVAHRSVVNTLTWMQGAWGLGAREVVLQKTPYSFDASLRELIPPLLVGARMVVARPGGHRDAAYLLERVRAEQVTTLHFVPSMLQVLVDEADFSRCTSLERVVCGGEALPRALVERFHAALPGARLYNVYGPTEAAVDVTAWSCAAERGREGSIPIGAPMANVRLYVLDRAGEPVPAGVAGELYIGGVQVARGYLNRAALTADRFVPDRFGGEAGGRLYRTGDLARWRPDGAVDFLGRGDAQVKVRGYRIELGEIEARLREHALVREAVVLAREDTPGNRRLVAYVVGDAAADAEALRAHLSERLPEYMVPAAYVRLEALPLTPNGKVNRRALPAPDADAFAARGYEAPSGAVEQAVAEIWAELLGVERVGRGDHFFEMGGHSLLAVRVVSRVRQALRVEAVPGDVFERPVLADFARGLGTAAQSAATAITPVDRDAAIPLSFAQQRLWFLEQLGGTGAAYNVPMRLRLQGALDRGALVRSLDRILARHEVLRTTFPAVDGEPVQRIAAVEKSALRLVEHDLRASADAEDALHRLMADEASAPFDLARGPLIRGRLIRVAADDHVLLLTMHHIVSDGWSTGVLHGELGALYAAFVRGDADPLPPLPVQYADYAAWHRRLVDGAVLDAQAEYWTRTLAGAPELLELPADRPRPAKQDSAGASVDVELDEALTEALKTLSQRHGTTLFMTLLAGWAAVLARLSGQDDVVIGTPSANRGRAEVEELIGFFVNTLPVRVDLSRSPSVAELLAQVKGRALEAQRNQDIPFEQVVERLSPARSLAYSPLFQVMFAWQNASGESLDLPGLQSEAVSGPAVEGAKFDLTLTLVESGDRIVGELSYATALCDRATVERWVGYLRRALEEMAADDHQPVERLALMPESERFRVVEEWSHAQAAPPAEQCIHHLFEAQAARTPDAVALVHEGEQLTYAQLDARANRLAHRLAAVGVERGAAVGVCLEWHSDLVVALLATLKAGGVYVPLDPSLPSARLAYIAEDAGVRAVVTRAALADRVPSGVAVRVDVDADEVSAVPGEAPRTLVFPEDLAYVIYTSGSTGRPKGVAVEHGAAAAHLLAVARVHGIVPEDRVLQFASAGFDVSLEQVFFPLLTGATLVLRGAELWSATEFRARVRALGITVANLPPAYWQEVADGAAEDALDGIRLLLIGGDALPASAADARGAGRLVNCYGPTETVVTATAFAVERGAAGGPLVPIGRPLPGRGVYVLDASGAPVPVGVAGELYIGGPLLARGYLGRPALTAERFVPDPFAGAPGARLYRTGDRVRWSASGNLEFLGRTDFQVKIRGFRIELGEIEAALRSHDAVRDAVVLARADAPGDPRLVAYLVGDADAEALRAHLSERLPEYMLPAAYVRLDALPLTPNGKVDRKALPAPDGDAFPARGYEAPSSRVEQAVSAIWAELLGAERVGRGDHFFELGGHSLLAVRVVSRVRQALGVEALPGDVFERPVLADFARGLETAAGAEAAAIERVDRTGNVPLSFAQQRLWFLEQLGNLGSTYQVSMSLRLRGDLDRDALVRSLDRIVARHEVLRTTFPAVDGEPVQHIAPAEESGLRLVEHDLHAAPDAEDELRRLVQDEASAPFDLARGPLVRGRLVRMAADDHVLLLTMHHIVSDGWSAGVLFRELGALYTAFARGEPDPLAPLPMQYAEYAAWHRRWVEGPVLEAQAEYWTRTLAGVPELLELPADHPRPAKQDFAGASLQIELDEALTAALNTLSQRHGTTLFMTLLAGWATVLSRLSGQDDVVIGTPSANRGRAEVEELIGFFVNTLPVRVDLSDGPRVGELLQRVKTRALEAQRNQDIPFEQVVERVRPARSLAYSPLFQVMFAWQNAPDGTLELPGLAVVRAGGAESDTAKFDLTLTLGEDGGRIAGSVEYATALFERATVERFVEYLRRVLAGMAQDDAVRVDGIPLLPAAERARLVEEWNAGDAAPPAEQCIHHLFEAQAARTPDAVALVHEGEQLTYAQLDARANRLAHRLVAVGVERGAAVGVCLEWRPELVVALLATLKAGGVYVPLDPSLPSTRLAYIAEDAGVRAVVTRAGLADRVPSGVAVRVDVDADEVSAAPGEAPRALVFPEDLAYVIYTSGSTGRPKGVAVEHGAAAAHFAAVARVHGIVPEDRVLQFASAGFDVSLEQVFFPLLTGATLVLRGAELWSASEFRARVRALGITVANLPPAYWQEVADGAAEDALDGIRLLLIGGDALPASAADGRGAGRLVNCYGPTETVVTATAFEVVEGFGGSLVPIGRPLPGRAVYVLDASGAPVPVGVAGELYIGGPLLARGYLGRAALTAERFVPDPFGGEAGGRLYRTGDRVRWSASGNLEFLGRTDFQVKIRGFRIELGEIEAALRSYDAVRDAVVLARADAPGDPRLVAYLVGDADAEALRAHLSERLPEYMLPAAYVRLETLPLTPNGKVDRKALPAPDGDAFPARGYEAPSGQVEQTVSAIWAELLGAERVGRGDHFFELGGHSLLAVRVVSRVRQALGVEALPGDLFERPVLADFARGLGTAARGEAMAITPVDRSSAIPLSFAQQRLWFLEQLGGTGAAYHVPMSLRLHGDLDRGALERALDRIVARHEALRTTFPTVDGEPVQRIAPVGESGFRLVEHDLHAAPDAEDELRRLVQGEASALFDLTHGPLVRGRLVRMTADDHVLLLTMHHIVSDGWSAGVLFRELSELYAAFARGEPDPLPPLPVQYADYAAWHRRSVEGPVLEAQAEYWTRTLAGAPELLELPADHPRPPKQDFTGASVNVELDEALTDALKTLSRRHGTTLFMTLLAGWAAVLSRLSGQDDVVIGTPSANRGRAEVEELIGFFVNTLPVRVDLSDGPRVGELLQQVKTRALEAQRNQDIPFEQVVELVRPARSLAYSPLFQVMFAWQNAGDGTLELPGLAVGPLDPAGPDGSSSRESAKFDLTLALAESGARIVGALSFATALFDRGTVERHVGYLRRVLEEMAADDSRRVERLELMPGSERTRVLEAWNRTEAEHPADACVHHLVQAQAARTPHAVAVAHEDGTLTYGELNARANRLAHHLAGLGVGADARVALCVERGPEMVVGMLAVLKAGGAYVPLDPAYPDERLRYMLADSRPAVLLAPPALAARFAGSGVPVLDPADEWAWARHPDTDPRPAGLSPDHLCYVIYTSGSTGRPKGVAVPHRGVLNLVRWHRRAYAVTADDRATQFASPAFDAAAWETWPYLASGAELHLLPAAVRAAPAALLGYFSRARITLAFLPTPVAEAVLDEIDRVGTPTLALRALLTGGDVLHRGPGAAPFRLVNHYGPTESSVVSTAAEVPADCAGAPPIGLPIENQAAYVLDPRLLPVPVGVAGELFVGGAGLARGYLGRPALTAERFVPDPFGRAPGGRLYRTGDRVSRRADGEIEYRGRTDFQVKVRGFRIELGEIEAALRSHPAVRDAVVLAREDAPGEKRLVAYLVADADAETLRAHLSERLPEYMVPAAYVRMDELPLTPNGKLDRRALPAPEGDAFATRGYEAPSGDAEQAVAAIWAELLRADRVGRGDHFFELGGHSLLAVRVVSRVRQELGVAVSPGDLFERPVLADFARGLETAVRAEAMAIAPVDRSSAIPLSFAQQRLWFLEQLGGTGAAYHVPMRLRLRGELDHEALVRALDRIVARHEALRTTFPTVDGEPVQRIAPVQESALRLVENDLRAGADAEDELRRLVSDEASASFDLARGPLVRGRLVRMGADDHVLLLTMHHIVSDGWSAGVLFRELGALYTAFARGEPDPLPPLPVQYADYAAWHRRWMEGPVLEAQAEYWAEALAGAPELLELPADHPRPPRQDFAGASLQIELDESLTASLRTLSQRHGTTLYMTLLAGWATVLARLSGQADVVIGTPSANRGRAEVEELIGFFVNTLPVRVDLSDGPRVGELLQRVKTRTLEAQRNQDIPFEQVVELLRPARSLAYSPLFQVMFAWQNASDGTLELPGLQPGAVPDSAGETAKFDLTLTLAESGDRIVGGLNYATALFDRATVERWVGYLRRVLEEMAADERQPVDRLAVMPESERFRVVEEWNATDAGYPAGACVHDLFRAQAARTPEAVALSWRGERLTYAQLEARANGISNALRRRGVGPEVRVGICLPRTPDLVAAMLGVLGAGGAYVPLDPAYPRERLGYMLEDAGVTLVITDSTLADRLPESAAALLLLDVERDAIAAESADALESGVVPENLSHVIFTSGSTGRPKGVMIRHSSVVILLHWLRENVTDEERSSVLFSTSINFDVSIAEVFGTLAWGGKLVIAENALELATISEPVFYASMVPSAAAELLQSGGIPACVKTLNLGGEALPNALAQGLYGLGTVEKVGNLYGPTEDTTYSTYSLVPRGADQVFVGRPVSNTRAYVLDDHLQPVPAGVIGELYLAGDGLSRGYANRPAMTAERFVPCPFGAPGARMYRVMDRVRWKCVSAEVRECGSEQPADSRTDALTHSRTPVLEYLGRTDFQVKVRGYRIELGEIEARLAEHPGVRAPVVLAREDAPGDRRLVAYYLGDAPVAVDALKSHLSDRLPGYMVPAAYVWMKAYPLTPNGKTDRRTLPAPGDDAYAAQEYEAPMGETEQAVAAIWADLLGVERVGRHDDFFQLGGNSLLATRLVFRIRREMDVDLPVSDVFEKPELSLLAQQLLDAQLAQFDPDQLQELLALARAADGE